MNEHTKPQWTDHLKAVSSELDAEITKELSEKPSIMKEHTDGKSKG